ncbi:MAG: TetR/AcrR family transcriptional regulator [Arcobacteraceae bacterium]|nr:TetR/AcrR family transcriptional regulator [Arcobacteraceae bacterium]MDY0327852.1 TetR/AcrR family transcriptional regulator [Arcobacteraceae bacterium]
MKLINREERIKLICDEAYKAFVKVGIDNFSLNKFIIDIKMSKGQFYHYFTTKEQLIYQVISEKTFELIHNIKEEYKNRKLFTDKLNLIFALYLNDEEYYRDLRKLYIDTLHMYIISDNDEIKEANNNDYKSIYNILEQLFEEEIEKGNFQKDSISLAKSIYATADGMFLQSLMVNNYDLKLELSNYFLEIEKLLKKK